MYCGNSRNSDEDSDFELEATSEATVDGFVPVVNEDLDEDYYEESHSSLVEVQGIKLYKFIYVYLKPLS